jgi:hypothetical protein
VRMVFQWYMALLDGNTEHGERGSGGGGSIHGVARAR